MPRRRMLSPAERDSLLALPADRSELIRLYTLSDADLAVVRLIGDQRSLGIHSATAQKLLVGS